MGWFANAFELLAKGGYVMIPLMICSVVSVAVLIERYFKISKAQADVTDVIHCAKDAVYAGTPDRALSILEPVDSPIARVMHAGIRNRHLGERGAERAMEEQGTREVAALTHRLGLLDTIITIAPLLGLLGTVTGMISAFHVIAAKSGISTPTAITGGVAEALIATATGLAVAIITLIGHNHLQERIKNIVSEIEARGNEMVNVLVEAGEEPRSEIKRISA
ncbi:MAG: MotA/TolQ/ExbB proton channel family protein [Armatimonadota bacterium]|nr:MotA/TolQ/ExbB proton channel family protein [bacterium]